LWYIGGTIPSDEIELFKGFKTVTLC